MKTLALFVLFVAIAVLFFFFWGKSDAAARRLDQMENEVAQTQQDLGELKQELQLLLKRDHPDD